MMYFLTREPLWISGGIIVGLGVVLSMLGPVLVRRYIKLDRLTANNEIAGFKFATIGVLYAVLLAFAIIVVWQKFNDAETDVVQEAGAATTIYRLSVGLGDKPGAALRGTVSNYLKAAIAQDWPAMGRGVTGASQTARHALDTIYSDLLTSDAARNAGTPVMVEILHQLDLMTQARRARMVAAEGAVPGVMWLILFGGAIVVIGFTFFFGTFNLRAQIVMTGLLALLIFSELFIIVTIDRPFTGTLEVHPTALALVLGEFQGDNTPH